MKKLILIAIILMSTQQNAHANNWSASVGYNNPPGANVGLNFMYLWTNWAFELGIGSVQQTTTNTNGQDSKTTSVLGDANFKYLFSSGVFRPYLQGGMGSSVSVTNASGVSASAGLGGSFFGGGIFLLGNPIYAYASYNVGGSTSFTQIGIGCSF